MSTSTSAPLLGVVLSDRYELVRHIARGGMGDVYEATDRQLRRQVAVKVYRSTAPTDRSRFDAEVLTLAALNHPALVHVFDAGEHDGDGFVVLELVDGPPLRAVIAERGRLPSHEVAALGETMADALAYVHDKGVVHRDVTPANVLCGPDGRPRLADFGIARLLDTSRVTAAASAIGTAAYMAPEQVEGRDVTPSADVYSLGLVLREALTGHAAFTGPSHEVALARLVRDPDVQTDVPAEWHEILAAMTARDPAARPSAAVVAARLALLAADDARAATPPSPEAATGSLTVTAPLVVPAVGAASIGDHATAEVPRTALVHADAPTEAVDLDGGTTVMPVAMRPVAPEAHLPGTEPAPGGARRSRRALWAVLAAIGIALLVGLTSAGGGIDVPATTTTTTPVAVTSPPTTAAPTTTAAPAAGPQKGHEGKGKGNGKN